MPDAVTRVVEYLSEREIIENLDGLSNEKKLRIVDKLYQGKYNGWIYEEEIRVNGSREELDEETGQYFVDFSEKLILREVIAGARFKLSKKPIEDALRGHSDVRIVKLRTSTTKFELIVDGRESW